MPVLWKKKFYFEQPEWCFTTKVMPVNGNMPLNNEEFEKIEKKKQEIN